jgi:hypothetical protein
MLQTVWGLLLKVLRLQLSERLLIRGEMTSIGLAAATIAKKYGAIVGHNPQSGVRTDSARQRSRFRLHRHQIDCSNRPGDIP